jgi:YD repeat-containing protein
MPSAQESVQYDATLRPVHQVFANGVRLHWQYDTSGATETHLTLPGGERYTVSRSADHRQHTWRLPAGGTYRAESDAAGRVTSLWQGDRSRLRLRWHPDGQLAQATSETAALHPEYRPDGLMSGLLVTTLEKGPRFSRWLHVTYDKQGRTAQVQDYTGSDIRLGYDHTGRVARLDSSHGSMQLQRDPQGRVATLRTSWGTQQDNTYEPQSGMLQKTVHTQDGSMAAVDFDQGKPTRMQQFDGGELRIAYYNQGLHKGQIQYVRAPNDLLCTYAYDAANRLSAMQCGTTSRVEFTYDTHDRLVGFAQAPVRQ